MGREGIGGSLHIGPMRILDPMAMAHVSTGTVVVVVVEVWLPIDCVLLKSFENK